MDHILKKYCPRIEFDSYEDFVENFKIDVPADFNFGYDVVDEWARVEPDKRALVWCNDHDEERTFTFTDISLLSNKAANAFTKLGIRKGDVVMCILRRRWEYWVIATALCKIGATIIPATLQLTAKDIAYRAQSANVKMLVCVDDDYVCTQAETAMEQVPGIQERVVVGGERAGWIGFDRLIADEPDQWERPTGEAATCSKDLMLIYFTSGTTGNPKAVMHNFAHPLGHIITAKYWQQVQENKLHMSVTDSGWAKFGWGKTTASGSAAPRSLPMTWTSSCPPSCSRRCRTTSSPPSAPRPPCTASCSRRTWRATTSAASRTSPPPASP